MLLTRLPFCIFLFFAVYSSNALGITDVYFSSGSATGSYSESIDGQSKELLGTENSISFRKIQSLSILDLGIDLGNLNLNGDTESHRVGFQLSYANLTAGVNLNLYPSWIEYFLDIGYRFGFGRLDVQKTGSNDSVNSYTFQTYNYSPLLRYGAKFLIVNSFFLAASVEKKGRLIQKTSVALNPTINNSHSITVSFGYRFGGKSNAKPPSQVQSGKPNYSNPCMLFKGGAC